MASSTTQTVPSVPTEPHKRRLDLSGKQIGASAGAAVTSALGASFFGATGTIAGAAVGSVISTIAAAIYTRSIEGAHTKLRETTVVVRKVPPRGAGPAAVPNDLPEVEAGAERQAAEETHPVDAPATQAVEVTGTTAMPAQGATPDAPPPFFRGKRLLVLAAVMLSGFVLAMGGITLAEKLIGHPVSGGTGGTSFGEVATSGSGGSTDREPEPATTATPTESATSSPEASESAAPSETSSPEASTTVSPEPSATPEPSASEAPTAEPTQDPGVGTESTENQGAGAAPAPTAASND